MFSGFAARAEKICGNRPVSRVKHPIRRDGKRMRTEKTGHFFPDGPYPEREENRMDIFPPASGSKHRRTMIRYR